MAINGKLKYKKVKKYLLQQIDHLSPGDNRLETEEVLSAKLGVSKATIRQPMDELISEDLITRLQGKGVFGHPRVSKLAMNLGGKANFRDYLSRSGYRVSVTQSPSIRKEASSHMVKRVPEMEGKKVYSFTWTYYANDNPVIICRVEVPIELVVNPFTSDVPPLTLKDSIKGLSGRAFAYAISWFRGAIDSSAAEFMNLPPDTVFLVWDENFFDLFDHHLCYNEILFHPDYLDFSIICHF